MSRDSYSDVSSFMNDTAFSSFFNQNGGQNGRPDGGRSRSPARGGPGDRNNSQIRSASPARGVASSVQQRSRSPSYSRGAPVDDRGRASSSTRGAPQPARSRDSFGLGGERGGARPSSPAPVANQSRAMDFERLLDSSETKKLSSTPDRMRSIEVKPSPRPKLEAKSAISDPDTGLVSFLKEALSEDQGEQRGRSLPTPPSRAPRPSTYLPRPSVDNVRLINPPNPPNGFTSDPNLQSRGGPSRAMSPMGRMTARGTQDESDEDDELFDRAPKKKGQVSLAEFLRTSEPPPPSKPVPLVDPSKVKKGLFARKQSTPGPTAPSGPSAAPAQPKKYQMIHIPYELPELNFEPTTTSSLPSSNQDNYTPSSVQAGVSQSYSNPSTPTTQSSQPSWPSPPVYDSRGSLDGRPSLDTNRVRRVPDPPVNSSRIPAPTTPTSIHSVHSVPPTPTTQIQRKPVPLPATPPQESYPQDQQQPQPHTPQHHQTATSTLSRVGVPNPVAVVEPESQRAVVLNIPTPQATPPASPSLLPVTVAKAVMVETGTDAEDLVVKPLMKDKETDPSVETYQLRVRSGACARSVAMEGKSVDEVVAGLVGLDSAFGVVGEVLRRVRAVGAVEAEKEVKSEEVVEGDDGKWVVVVRPASEGGKGDVVEATVQTDVEEVQVATPSEAETIARSIVEQLVSAAVPASEPSIEVIEVVEVEKSCAVCAKRDLEAFVRGLVEGCVHKVLETKVVETDEDLEKVVRAQAYVRGRLARSRVSQLRREEAVPVEDENLDKVIRAQAYVRGHLARRGYKALREGKEVVVVPATVVEEVAQEAARAHAAPIDESKVIKVQAYVRGQLTRRGYYAVLDETTEKPAPAEEGSSPIDESKVVKVQAYVRGQLTRRGFYTSLDETSEGASAAPAATEATTTTEIDTQTPSTPTTETPTQTPPTPTTETTTQTPTPTHADTLVTESLASQLAALRSALVAERVAREKAERVAEERRKQVENVEGVVKVQEECLGVLARVAYGVVEGEIRRRGELERSLDGLVGYVQSVGGKVKRVDA
ncbi:hypothetical protein HDV00_000421 [Rhizophlyctis rosea]|nr:hypothetical protein HDV00_000421 [Rhizophlyctis rosea]